MATHKADGIYYTNLKRLTQIHACLTGRRDWVALFGEGDVLITLDNMKALNKKDDTYCHWLATKMYYAGLLTFDEYWGVDNTARALMNALARRAKREGLLQ